MTGPDQKPDPSNDESSLKDWLQLPDDYVESNDGDDRQEKPVQDSKSLADLDTGPVSIGKESPITGEPSDGQEQVQDQNEPADETAGDGHPATQEPIPDQDSFAPEDPVELELFPPELLDTETGKSTDEIEGTPVPAGESGAELDEIEKLEKLLRREFGDTLTGANAHALPIGILFIFLGILVWFNDPILGFLGLGGYLKDLQWAVMLVSGALSLAGVHLFFYWWVHRISNSVKSRELDRLIGTRRVDHPCSHLDCEERHGEDADGEIDTEADLVWKCGLFNTDLDESAVCVVCDKYDPIESLEPDMYGENQFSDVK